ncbi:MAG: NAD(+) synthase [Prevotellaceae bacterium]|jgi:NAD+ synthase (glutamine-hydrolysing)|nr:NAD(+) synthase [Prevotellaceae bacterium]
MYKTSLSTDTYGFVRLAGAVPRLRPADCIYNAEEIQKLIVQAGAEGVQILCFPELSITGYSCGDLFNQGFLIRSAEASVSALLDATRSMDLIFIIGVPVFANERLFNCAVVCQSGKILGIVSKKHLSNYNEFYEKRWFISSDYSAENVDYAGFKNLPFGCDLLFRCRDFVFGAELCEDLWVPSPHSASLATAGAQLIFNLSASNDLVGKHEYRRSLVVQQSARCIAGYVYVSSGLGESTSDLVFGGNTLICENGRLLSEANRFQLNSQLTINEIDIELLLSERHRVNSFSQPVCGIRYIDISCPQASGFRLTRHIAPLPFVPADDHLHENCEEILAIQTCGLARRMQHTSAQSLLIGVSGGLDSTLALLVCVGACDRLGLARSSVIGVTMPGFGTSRRTYRNAMRLMQTLGVTVREIDIKAACLQHFADIGHKPEIHNTTYENTQARERTQILMDLANQTNGLVVGTGDMSELALGWCTYNGDHISMYSVNSSVPKTLVRSLVKYIAETLNNNDAESVLCDIIDTPVSPELIPEVQETESIVGQYELHDFFMYYFIRYGFAPDKLLFLASKAFDGKYSPKEIVTTMETFFRRFFAHQFKRSCMPEGPKIGSVSLSPRGDWRMPGDANPAIWMKSIEALK